MTTTFTTQVQRTERWSRLAARALRQPAALIFNPNAGQKLGLETNSGNDEEVQAALRAEGVPFDPWPTERAGHATDLARQAVAEGREFVIAAGGDGTVNEVAHGLANSQTVLGLMPLGSVMNVARTLWVPRDLAGAARTIAEGKVLAMDMGRIGDRFFLEAAGVGLDAGLFGYFERLDSGGRPLGIVRAALRFLRRLGTPRITLEHEGGRLETSAPMGSMLAPPTPLHRRHVSTTACWTWRCSATPVFPDCLRILRSSRAADLCPRQRRRRPCECGRSG